MLACAIYYYEGHVWVKRLQELNCMVGLSFKIGSYYTKANQQEQCLILFRLNC
jgi:hypothetical protein